MCEFGLFRIFLRGTEDDNLTKMKKSDLKSG
jgi:hypothetical protein